VPYLYGVLGLVVGALLNLAADSLPQRRLFLPQSLNPRDGGGRSWREAVALLGLSVVRGQWRSAVVWRRVVLTVFTALSFAVFWMRYGPSVQLLLVSLYTCVLFLIFVIDLEHRLILWVVVYPAMWLALVGSHFYPGLGLRRAVIGGVLAFLFFFLVAALGRLIFRRMAMGGGDANLAACVGLITGFPEVVLALLITVCLGGLVSLGLVVGGFKGLRSYIPYGVFLASGGWLVLVFGQEILRWYLGLY
jgi:leader peptidase (prepilin peptidase)/N-methyltransferase